jgi:hypothetical protein
MARKSTRSAQKSLDGTEACAPPHPPKRRRVALRSIAHVAAEMRRVYFSARFEETRTQDASRLVFMLQAIRDTLKVGELEQRIQALEDAQRGEKR